MPTLAPEKAPSRSLRDRAGAANLSVWVFTILLFLAIGFAEELSGAFAAHPTLSAIATVFAGIFVQAIPFVALGVVVSALIATFLPGGGLRRVLPRSERLAVFAAGLYGVGLPACECASAPIAGRMLAAGAGRGAAVAFLLAAPAINPVVIAATFVAFPGHPQMALARFVASLIAAWLVGLIFLKKPARATQDASADEACALAEPSDQEHHEHGGRLPRFLDAARSDLLSSGSFLVIGAAFAAIAHALIPPAWLEGLSGNLVTATMTMAALAVVLSVCSEADAFVAASFTTFAPTAQLVFLVVSPMVDFKLIAMHVGIFGSKVAARLDVVIFVTATVVAAVVGGVILEGNW
jgi:hypothetical protein